MGRAKDRSGKESPHVCVSVLFREWGSLGLWIGLDSCPNKSVDWDGDDPGGWFPEQKISLEEAIKGYTINAAFTEFAEYLKGSLEEGKLADLVILDQNLFDISRENILNTRVIMTVLDGKIIYKN